MLGQRGGHTTGDWLARWKLIEKANRFQPRLTCAPGAVLRVRHFVKPFGAWRESGQRNELLRKILTRSWNGWKSRSKSSLRPCFYLQDKMTIFFKSSPPSNIKAFSARTLFYQAVENLPQAGTLHQCEETGGFLLQMKGYMFTIFVRSDGVNSRLFE